MIVTFYCEYILWTLYLLHPFVETISQFDYNYCFWLFGKMETGTQHDPIGIVSD